MFAIFDVLNKPMIDGSGCMAWQAACTAWRARLAAGTLLREFLVNIQNVSYFSGK